MVKRSKLTLEHPEMREQVEVEKKAKIPELTATKQAGASDRQVNLGKMLIVTGLSIASLIIFKQKIF